MSTPLQHGKRSLDADAASAEPTRKAPRINDGKDASGSSSADESIHEHLLQIQEHVRALKAKNPGSFDEAALKIVQTAYDDLGKLETAIEEQHEAIRNPPPEEKPMPFDHLVLVLSCLPAADLAMAAATSRHFARAIPEAVRTRLDKIAQDNYADDAGPTHFQVREEYSTALLHKVEEDYEHAPALIAELNRKSDASHRRAFKELREIHTEVLYLWSAHLWEKLAKFRQAALDGDSDEEDDEEQIYALSARDDVVHLLYLADIPDDELAAHADAIVAELFDPEEIRASVAAVGSGLFTMDLMEQLPLNVIEENVGKLMKFVRHTQPEGSNPHQYYALKVLSKLPGKTLARLNIEHDLAPLAKADDRDTREIVVKLLRAIRYA